MFGTFSWLNRRRKQWLNHGARRGLAWSTFFGGQAGNRWRLRWR